MASRSNVASDPQEPGTQLALPGDFERRLRGTLTLATAADRVRVYNAIQPADLHIEDVIAEQAVSGVRKVFDLIGWIAYPVAHQSLDTGELSEWTQTVMLLADGRRIDTGSGEILRSLESLSAFYPVVPWMPPLKVQIRVSRSAQKRDFYTLDLQE